jgi:hypothetical protein
MMCLTRACRGLLAFGCVMLCGASHAGADTGANTTGPATKADGGEQALYAEALQILAEGRRNDASDALFKLVSKVPQHAGAFLDLALIQCQLGHPLEAERLFREIETRFSPPPGILEVIAAQRANGCLAWQRQRHWSATLGRGHEQNVNQGASNPFFSFGSGPSQTPVELSPDFLPQADNYTALAADYSLELTSNGTIGLAQLQARHNDRLSQYDNASLYIGVERPWRFNNWGLRTSATLGVLRLDGHLYQRQSQLQARLTPPLRLPKAWQFNFSTGATNVQYATLANFDSVTLDLRAQLNYRKNQTQAIITAGYANDHAAAERPGGDRQGWFTSILGRTRIGDSVFGELGWTRQTWRGQSAYLAPTIPQTRDQETQVLRAALLVPLNNRHSLQIELRHVRNKENISIFQYNNNQIQVNWLLQGAR